MKRSFEGEHGLREMGALKMKFWHIMINKGRDKDIHKTAQKLSDELKFWKNTYKNARKVI